MKPLISRRTSSGLLKAGILFACMGATSVWAADSHAPNQPVGTTSGTGAAQSGAAPNARASHNQNNALPDSAPGINTDISNLSPELQKSIRHGHDIAVAADCAACHSLPSSSANDMFAGGYAISSPMGVIYSTNITPSKQDGIGNYSESDFARAVREGVRKDGANLYPAMPYTSYTGISDSDIHDLYTYFMHGVKPVNQASPITELPFPFNIRASMKAWNLLFLHDQRFHNDPSKSAELNRGAYLVGPLEHCSACHTPRNFLMAEKTSQYLSGGSVGSWFAPNITSDKQSGIGSWSEDQIVQYLKTGRVPGKAQAGAGMSEAIEHSLQYLPDSDLHAIAAYLKSTRPIHNSNDEKARFDYGRSQKADLEGDLRGMHSQDSNNTMNSGEALYSGFCASCHQPDGSGSHNQAYPSLFNNSVTGADNTDNLVSVMLNGLDRNANGHHVLMPGFGENSYVDELSDQQIASIANYVTHTFGNPKLHTTPEQVAQIRAGGAKPFLALVQPYVLPGIIVVGVIVLLLIIWAVVARGRKKSH